MDERPQENFHLYTVLDQINKKMQQNKAPNQRTFYILYIASPFRIFPPSPCHKFSGMEHRRGLRVLSCTLSRCLPDLWPPREGPRCQSDTGKVAEIGSPNLLPENQSQLYLSMPKCLPWGSSAFTLSLGIRLKIKKNGSENKSSVFYLCNAV